MARYRCFCMTEAARIITGRVIEADNVREALETARADWRHLSEFAWVEIWLGSDCIYPPVSSPSFPQLPSGRLIDPVALDVTDRDAISPAARGRLSERVIGVGAGQEPGRGMAMTAA